MAITTHREFWERLMQLAGYGGANKHAPDVAFVTGFCMALRIAAARPDFALAFERIEEVAGTEATGTEDVAAVVAYYLEQLEIAPEAANGSTG